jgi:branched-chain amino acid transport system ATP-binding protein
MSVDSNRPSPVLEVSAFSAGYGGLSILQEVTLQVGRGEIVTVIGPNGAGKSTLLKGVMGLLPQAAGVVLLSGRSIAGMTTERVVTAGVGYVPQEEEVFPTMSVRENLEMGGYLLDRKRREKRIAAVTEIFPSLADFMGRQGSKLSGGERKMVGIARALMSEPELLILDEPTAGLAATIASHVFETHITRLSGAGVAVLMVEQKADAALAVSDWSYVLVGGRVTRSGEARSMLETDLGRMFLEGAR